MERKPVCYTSMTTKTENDGRHEDLCNKMIWSCLHTYTRRLAYLPSDEFRNKMKDLRSKILEAIEKSESQPEPETVSQLQDRIVAICDKNGIPTDAFPEESLESGEQAEEIVKVSSTSTVKQEVISGSKKKKRRSRKKRGEEKPVVFLEDDAEDDDWYDYYRTN